MWFDIFRWIESVVITRLKNSGSSDKPCNFCNLYPSLKLQYRYSLCLKESCKFCLIEKDQLPPESFSVKFTRINRYETLELWILYLENVIKNSNEILEKLEHGVR